MKPPRHEKNRQAPTAFEIFLLRKEDPAPADSTAAIERLRTDERIRRYTRDPSRFLYQNRDTGVFFQLYLDGGVEEEVEDEEVREVRDGDGGGDGEDGVAEHTSDTEEEDEEAEEEAEEDGEAELAPITLLVPLLCPTFFGSEAIEFAEMLARDLGLVVEHGAPVAAEDPEGLAAEAGHDGNLFESWKVLNRAAAMEHRSTLPLTRWSERKCEEWRTYGTQRSKLKGELAGEGIEVPLLEAALHEDRVKSLCAWRPDMPAVLPRVDLVLIHRELTRKGLLFSKRSVVEGIASGDKVWDAFSEFAEVRLEPSPLLVFRGPYPRSPRWAQALEDLPLEPVERARKTELLGVIDFDLTDDGAVGGRTV
ncbi:MAG TPA: hypothetical protein VMT52_16555 [Planctomycetota bacterium]|nr:hypothetical protein [Planctomycetota bacterium]